MHTDLILLISVPLLVTVIVIIALFTCWIRRCMGSQSGSRRGILGGGHGYNKVNHELDEEEIEFKNMIERKADEFEFDELGDDIFADNKEDLQFNKKDKDRLSMIETLRNNLVSNVNMERKDNSDEEASENENIRL